MDSTSLEERDPFEAVRSMHDGIDDREQRIRSLRADLEKEEGDLQYMRETLGLIIGRNWGDAGTLQEAIVLLGRERDPQRIERTPNA
jgi:hypothetical protein